MWLLKITGFDYGYAVRTSPKIAHIILVIIYDSYLWKIGKLTVGKNATRVGFFILFFARVYNELIIRTFSNSIETIFQTIAFYYFLQVSNKFDRNLAILTLMLTVSFMIRNTSPIGWPPLILIKIIKDRSLIPFLIALITVFIPAAFLCIVVDSYFYNEFPVITSLNFMRVNLQEGLSKYYGSFPFHFYVISVIPLFFTVAFPAVIYGFYRYLKDDRGRIPYVAILSLFYLLIFSLIAHKEVRFMLPIIPFCGLMAGYSIEKWHKFNIGNSRTIKSLRYLAYLYIFVEVVMGLVFLNLHFRNW